MQRRASAAGGGRTHSLEVLCVHGFVPSQSRQCFDRLPNSLFRDSQLVEALQIEPELCAGPEKVTQTQRGISRDRAPPMQDLRDAIGRHANFSR